MKNIKNKKYIFFIFLFLIAIFVRLYNINVTARFTRDESSDLVSIKRIIDEKDITLIGPMSEGVTGIFSSLTYYISLPFVYFSKSDPLGPVIATSFYGLITVILIWIFLKNQKIKWLPIFLLPVIITPYVECSRWAWNPHFIPFWQILGLMALFSQIPFHLILTGILFGLTIHQHWYSVFSCLGLVILIYQNRQKFKDVFYYLIGLFISITPFIIFDITHPPGLFFSRMLYFSPISPNHFNLINILIKFIQTPLQFTSYLAYSNHLVGWIILLLSLFLIGLNIYQKKNSLNLFLTPVLLQFLGLSFISSPIANRYLIPCILFFILWLSKNINSIISKLIIIIIIFSSIFSLPKIIFQNDWTNNITSLKQITTIIKNESVKNNNSFNLVVLQSPDGNTKGSRFRDLLKIQNINPLPPEDYETPKTLFVISYNAWDKVKDDPAYELSKFRKNEPDNLWHIDNSQWILYQINRQSK